MTAAVDHPGSLPILLGMDKVRAELKLDSLAAGVAGFAARRIQVDLARELTNPMPATKQERAAAEKRLLQLNERFNKRALSVLNEDQRAKLSLDRSAMFSALLIVYAPGTQKSSG